MLRSEQFFTSVATEGAIIGPYRIALQGDGATALRAFRVLVENLGDVALTVTPQVSTDGTTFSDFAGSADTTIQPRCERVLEFYVAGENTHWRVTGTGATEGRFTILQGQGTHGNVMTNHVTI